MEKVIVKFSIDEDGIVELLKIGEYEQYDKTMLDVAYSSNNIDTKISLSKF